MRTIRLYAHLIAPIGDGGVEKEQYKAIWKCCDVAESLIRMFKGRGDCSSCGVIQYTDTIYFDNISDKEMDFILSVHPFIREVNKPFKWN